MAHKSKTQRAKAQAVKANKKDRQLREEAASANEETVEAGAESAKQKRAEKKEAKPKQQAAAAMKKETKPKKVRFQFLRDVRAEMKRVTWPSRQDVIRWSGVVVGALIFFGVYVAVLDYAISEGLLGLANITAGA